MSALKQAAAGQIIDALRAMPEAAELNRSIRKTRMEWAVLSGGMDPDQATRAAVVISTILGEVQEGRTTPPILAALAVIREELVK